MNVGHKQVLRDRLKEEAETEKQKKRRARTPVPIQRQSTTRPPRPESSRSQGELPLFKDIADIGAAFTKLQEDVKELQTSINAIGRYLVRLEQAIRLESDLFISSLENRENLFFQCT